MPLPYRRSGLHDESVIGSIDSRKLVAKEDFGPGGKYRCKRSHKVLLDPVDGPGHSIVKLFLRFQNAVNAGSWAIATGWLIAPDLLVTAGHCVFDWGYNQGKLVEIKAYIGYHGKTNANDPNVQFRKGKRVTTTPDWLKSGKYRSADLALIKVEPPFENVTPINYTDTPANGLAKLGVVGYPGDLRDSKTGEAGAHMYESYEPTSWSLAKNEYGMLEYQVDTYGGNSGSPVFREGETTSIGVHTYGGLINSATVLGEYGNLLDPYIKAINSPPSNEFQPDETETSFPTVPKAVGLPTPGMVEPSWGPGKGNHKNQFGSEASDAEGWMRSLFKTAWKLATETEGHETDPDTSVEFGESGPLVGPMASIALQSGFAVQDSAGPLNRAAIIHRAVLGEAALAAVVKMSPQVMQEFGIIDKMTKIVQTSAPEVSRCWRRYGAVTHGPIIRTLAKGPFKPGSLKPSLSDPKFTSELTTLLAEDGPTETGVSASWESAHQGYRSLIEGLVDAAGKDGQPIQSTEFWGALGSLVAGPAIKVIGGWAYKKIKGESGQESQPGSSSVVLALDNAPLRALVGDAALQVLATVPRSTLAQEHAFESMWSVFKSVLPSLLHAGGDIAKAVMETHGSSTKEPIKILPFPKPGEKPTNGAEPDPSEFKFPPGFRVPGRTPGPDNQSSWIQAPGLPGKKNPDWKNGVPN
ncbi:MAG: hypothetical protein LQ349_006282 [Xanthoria aureola]|nr:MAG: hypothetical protein LQ349_006282 [Xanthoria aureola]